MAPKNLMITKSNPPFSSKCSTQKPKTNTNKYTHKKNPKSKSKGNGFETFGLNPNVYRAIKRKGYINPTPIQRKTIPLILSNYDVVAMARTGSGKTAAFLIPMFQKLHCHVPSGPVRALILSPTRDLALQTFNFALQLGRYTDLRTCSIVGGDKMDDQFEEMAQNPDIIVATPGRLMHHLSEVKDLSLRSVEYVVFDEADCLFEMGYAEQLHTILNRLSESRQTLLFSATLPRILADFAKAGFQDPQLVRLDVDRKISPDLDLVFFSLREEEKCAALLYLIREHISSSQQTIIFVSTRYHVEFFKLLFTEEGIEVSIGYSEMDPDARKINASRFRSRKTMLLIVTDVAARGIDIPSIDNVINLDFPPNPKMFVHRVGRTARVGRLGTAYSFVTCEDMPYLLDLHLFLSRPLRAAPSEYEVLQDMNGAMAKIDQAFANGETVYGRFPQTVLGFILERVRQIINTNTDLTYLEKTCRKAFGKYTKGKPPPSKESIRRVKELPREGLHPMFRDVLGGNELTALAFSDQLKSFRPKETILEAEAKWKRLEGPTSQWVGVMQRKRAIHEDIIDVVHQKRSKKDENKEADPDTILVNKEEKKETCRSKRKAKSFKDEEYFISPVPTNKHTEAGLSVSNYLGVGSNRLDSAVMDLVADDIAGIQKQKSVYHWDKKRKRYIKLNNGERVSANGKVKTESGQRVKVRSTGIYERWKEQSHNKICSKGIDGARSTDKENSCFADRLHRTRFTKFHKHHSHPNAHVPSEIKDLEQVRKERQKKASWLSYIKSNSSKGRKRVNSAGQDRKTRCSSHKGLEL